MPAEFLEDVEAEFFPKVIQFDSACLQLQNQFPNHHVARLDRKSTAQRQLSLVQKTQILFPSIDILHVDAAQVTEGSHARAEHVGAVP